MSRPRGVGDTGGGRTGGSGTVLGGTIGGRTGGGRTGGGAGTLSVSGWLLALAVAVAFADASIVVLAAPELLAEYDSTVSAVSWVVTGYNVAIVVAAIPVLLLVRRRGWLVLTAVGLIVFLLASLGCATAGSLESLTWLRVVQGGGAALLLAGSLPLLARLAGSDRAGLAAWSAAAAVGAALGPAAGGLLTELFSWRSIFYVQAPLSAAALVALPRAARSAVPGTAGPVVPARPVRLSPATARVSSAPGSTAPGSTAPGSTVRLFAAHAGLAMISAALVGALFLVILLMINGWGATPLEAAGMATVLPVGTLAARYVTTGGRPRMLALAGCLTVAGGLASLAAVPDKGWATAAAALAVTGVGLGLAVPTLTEASIRLGPRLGVDGAISVAARHAGLVFALAAVTPLLASSLATRLDQAVIAGTEAGLSEPVPLQSKVSLARSLGEALGDTPAGELPDLDAVFTKVAPDGSLDSLQDTLSGVITTAVTGAFRDSFALCALCALIALVPAWLIGPGRRTAPGVPRPRPAPVPGPRLGAGSRPEAVPRPGPGPGPVHGPGAAFGPAAAFGPGPGPGLRPGEAFAPGSEPDLGLARHGPAMRSAQSVPPARPGQPTRPAEPGQPTRPAEPGRVGQVSRVGAVMLAPALAILLAVMTLSSGGRGTLAVPDPCTTQPAFALGGADGLVQQIALDTLDGAACDLKTSRAALLLTLLPESGQPQLDISDDELTPAIREGLKHAVDRHDDDGSLPGWLATVLRLAIRVGPVGWLVDTLRAD